MTTNVETPRLVVVGNGTRGPYTLSVSGAPITYAAASELALTRYTNDNELNAVLVNATDYTLSASAVATGAAAATFTLTAGEAVLASDEKIVVERVTAKSSSFALATTGGIFEAQVDKFARLIQELWSGLNRAVSAHPLYTGSVALPYPEANAFVAWGPDADELVNFGGSTDVGVSVTMTPVVQGTIGEARRDLRSENSLYFADYGAVGDGVADDTTAIVNCLAAALAIGAWAKGQAGKTYKTTSTISIASGAKIDIGGTLAPTSNNSITGLSYVGAGVGATTTLASSAAAGACQLVVSSAANAAVGRYVHLSWVNPTSTNTHRLTAKIMAVSGTTLDISESVPVAVDAAWTNTVLFFDGASGIRVKGAIDGAAAGAVRTITGITKANPAAVNYSGPQLVNGETCFVDGVSGMTEVNRQEFVVANATSSTFQLSGIDSSAYSNYVSGGAARSLATGLYLQYSSADEIDVEASNFTSSPGVSHFVGWGNRHRILVENCGTQQRHAYVMLGNSGSSVKVQCRNAAGASVKFSANCYCDFAITHAGGSGNWQYSSGGRMTQLVGNLYCQVDAGSATNSVFTNLAISSGNSYCTIYGGALVGAGQRALAVAGANGVGIWFSDQYNIGNTLFGFRVAGSNDNDIEVYSTDTENLLIGCHYDPAKVANLGYAEFIDDLPAASIASASTCQIGRATNRDVTVTGNAGIISFGSAPAGRVRRVRFAASLTITHNGTSLILPGAADITTAADDVGDFISLGSGNWLCASFKRQSAAPLAYASSAEALAMSSAAKALTPANLLDTKTERVLWYITAADMNSTADQAFTKNGTFSGFIVTAARLVNPSTSLTTAAGGIYNATSKGGAALVASSQTFTAAGAAGQGQQMTLAAAGAGKRSDSNLYLSLTTAQGAAATAELYLIGIPLS